MDEAMTSWRRGLLDGTQENPKDMKSMWEHPSGASQVASQVAIFVKSFRH